MDKIMKEYKYIGFDEDILKNGTLVKITDNEYCSEGWFNGHSGLYFVNSITNDSRILNLIGYDGKVIAFSTEMFQPDEHGDPSKYTLEIV